MTLVYFFTLTSLQTAAYRQFAQKENGVTIAKTDFNWPINFSSTYADEFVVFLEHSPLDTRQAINAESKTWTKPNMTCQPDKTTTS